VRAAFSEEKRLRIVTAIDASQLSSYFRPQMEVLRAPCDEALRQFPERTFWPRKVQNICTTDAGWSVETMVLTSRSNELLKELLGAKMDFTGKMCQYWHAVAG
jgi:hypothetical protein